MSKKRIATLLVILLLSICLVACGEVINNGDESTTDNGESTTTKEHVHNYQEATCTEGQKCACGATKGKALGHDYIDATCTSPKTCKRCTRVFGSSLGHDYVEATCTTPKICSRCETVASQALGHDYKDATCITPQICKRCESTTGEPTGHDFAEATCLLPQTCKKCEATNGVALGHTYDANNVCIRCEQVDPETLPTPLTELHVIDSDCYEVKNITDTYGYSYTDALWYIWGGYSTYNLEKKYSVFTCSIVAPEDTDGNKGVTIYVDDICVYTSEYIGRETAKIDIEINVSGATKLKIVTSCTYGGSYSVAIVNAQLTK